MMLNFLTVGGAVMGLGGIIMGVLFRLSRSSRRWEYFRAQYQDRDLWFFQRNTPLVLVPGGLFFLCGSLAAMLEPSISKRWYDILVLLSGVNLVLYFVLAAWAPDWPKPRWLREEDRKRGKL